MRSFKPESWMEFIGGVTVLLIVLFVGVWITIGVVNGVMNPPSPERIKADAISNAMFSFRSQCGNNGGVANVKVEPWTCKKVGE